jgi:hypothetical protein
MHSGAAAWASDWRRTVEQDNEKAREEKGAEKRDPIDCLPLDEAKHKCEVFVCNGGTNTNYTKLNASRGRDKCLLPTTGLHRGEGEDDVLQKRNQGPFE